MSVSAKQDDIYGYYVKFPSNKLYSIAKKFSSQQKFDSAQTLFSIIWSRYGKNSNKEEVNLVAHSLMESGEICYSQFNYLEAMNLYLRCVDICKEHHLDRILMVVYKDMGNIYSQHNDFEASTNFYKQSLSLSQRYHDSDIEGKVLYNIIITEVQLGQLNEAKAYFHQLEILKSPSSRAGFDKLFTSALISEAEGELEDAIDGYTEAFDFCKNHKNGTTQEGSARSSLARVYTQKKEFEKALALLHENEAAAKKDNRMDMLTTTYGELSNVYEMMGNKEEHLKYLSLFLEKNNEVYNASAFNSLKNAQFMHDLGQSQRRIENLTEEKASQHHRLLLMIIIVAVVSILVVALTILLTANERKRRQLAQAYRDLYHHNQNSLRSEASYQKRLERAHQKIEKLTAKQNLTDSDSKDFVNEDDEPISDRILNVMEHSDAYLQSDFTVDRLAQLVDCPSYLVSKTIKEEFGKNFRSFLNDYRVRKAMEYFNDIEHYGNYTVKAVAESVGYKSQSNFIAVFTRITGTKPSLFQKMALGQEET